MSELLDKSDAIELKYSAEIQEAEKQLEIEAKKQANKILKKNKREIDRLKKHAGDCLITNNKTGYMYALKKLRDFYKQPYNEELIEILWKTSRENIVNIKKQYENEYA